MAEIQSHALRNFERGAGFDQRDRVFDSRARLAQFRFRGVDFLLELFLPVAGALGAAARGTAVAAPHFVAKHNA